MRQNPVALRKESVDRNISPPFINSMILTSLSARRAWIEIFVPFDVIRPAIVALRKESVDRNVGVAEGADFEHVALRKESVDRNVSAFDVLAISAVALRKESVDRNKL